jgi:hypothetical protein
MAAAAAEHHSMMMFKPLRDQLNQPSATTS